MTINGDYSKHPGQTKHRQNDDYIPHQWSDTSVKTWQYCPGKPEIPQHENHAISQKCVKIFVLNLAYLFKTQLYQSVRICLVFT